MKIVLPLAGKGTRLLPHTSSVAKPMMFVAGETILDHLMKKLIPLNPTEFVFITGYLKDDLENYLVRTYPELPFRFIEQKEPQGLGHAIYQARDAFHKDEDMLVVLGDQTFSIDWDAMLEKNFNRLSVVPVEDPSSFGVVTLAEDGFVVDMEEKPSNPKSNLAISGTYYFPSAQSVFSALSYQIAQDIRTKGEIQITDSMRLMMESGEKFQALEISDWNDCGNHADLLNANQTLLVQYSNDSQQESSVTIIPPVWIDPSAKISHSTIGPNVSIAAHTSITNSILINSIVDQNTSIKSCIFEDSYLGRGLTLSDLSGKEQYLA